MPLQASLRPFTPAPTAIAGLPIPVLEPGRVPTAEASLAAPAAAPESPPMVLAALPTVPEDIDDDQPVPVPQARNRLVLGAPMPVPRPPELQAAIPPERSRIASPQPSRRTRTASLPAAPAAPVDNRSFFERFFGAQQRPANGPELAYAPSDDAGTAPVRSGGGRLLGGIMPGPGPVVAPGTAVYDITARTVYLPNGERLEAHSGLGDKMDDPRHVHVRMHGATPPHTYDLTERESLFHGVRALRLNPVGGSRAIHGRAGLLAHTYMLGPRGDSNGCISFRNYDRFLQAYLRGEVRRLIVVASAS
ncbi:MAG: DUF2778 domain-containing protein [Rhizobiales bacterium]|nr:DUF2778 domain-containing protein [Hyphomicrobiales bacterium]